MVNSHEGLGQAEENQWLTVLTLVRGIRVTFILLIY